MIAPIAKTTPVQGVAKTFTYERWKKIYVYIRCLTVTRYRHMLLMRQEKIDEENKVSPVYSFMEFDIWMEF